MCSFATFFHRKRENFIGCPFRLVYKATDDIEIKAFKLHASTDFHNHVISGGLDESPLKIKKTLAAKADSKAISNFLAPEDKAESNDKDETIPVKSVKSSAK